MALIIRSNDMMGFQNLKKIDFWDSNLRDSNNTLLGHSLSSQD